GYEAVSFRARRPDNTRHPGKKGSHIVEELVREEGPGTQVVKLIVFECFHMIDDREAVAGLPDEVRQEQQEAQADGIIEMAVGEYLFIPRKEEAGEQAGGIESHAVFTEHAETQADTRNVEVEGLARLLKSDQPIGHRCPEKDIQEDRLKEELQPKPDAGHEGHPRQHQGEPATAKMEYQPACKDEGQRAYERRP